MRWWYVVTLVLPTELCLRRRLSRAQEEPARTCEPPPPGHVRWPHGHVRPPPPGHVRGGARHGARAARGRGAASATPPVWADARGGVRAGPRRDGRPPAPPRGAAGAGPGPAGAALPPVHPPGPGDRLPLPPPRRHLRGRGAPPRRLVRAHQLPRHRPQRVRAPPALSRAFSDLGGPAMVGASLAREGPLAGRVSSTTRVSSALPGWPQLALLMF